MEANNFLINASKISTDNKLSEIYDFISACYDFASDEDVDIDLAELTKRLRRLKELAVLRFEVVLKPLYLKISKKFPRPAFEWPLDDDMVKSLIELEVAEYGRKPGWATESERFNYKCVDYY